MTELLKKQIQITSCSIDETRLLGQKIGGLLSVGTVVALTGDLGSGKTSFVQGLARGLDVPGKYYITSPTYTMINEYPGRLTLFHVDLYRIETGTDYGDIGLDDILYGDGVVAVEWANKLSESLPDKHIAMNLKILNNDWREIRITVYGLEEINLIKEIDSNLAV
jgi:tRNA threonylcarbamoyladenosine biosynthesis protein TsaE